MLPTALLRKEEKKGNQVNIQQEAACSIPF